MNFNGSHALYYIKYNSCVGSRKQELILEKLANLFKYNSCVGSNASVVKRDTKLGSFSSVFLRRGQRGQAIMITQ